MASDRVPREQLDACRPDSADLELPELAALRESLAHDADLAEQFDRILQFDRRIAAALRDVPVPPLLAAQITARLQPPPDLPADQAAVVCPSRPSPVWPGKRWVTRRQLMKWLAAAAVVPLAGWLGWRWWPRAARPVPAHEIAANLDTWLKMVGTPPGSGWKSPESLPPGVVPPAIRTLPQAWRPFRTRQGWSGIAVELAPPTEPRAILLVVQGSARFEVPARPYALLSTSMERAAAAWATQGRLFVLVVEQGGKPRLDQLIRPSPLA
jgi:hypothetical protein